MKFGELIRFYRAEKGLSKTDLAKALGVSLTYVIHIEQGKRRPPPAERINQLIEVFQLGRKEKEDLLRKADEERLTPEAKLILDKRLHNATLTAASLPPDVLEILNDPTALECLERLNSADPDVKELYRELFSLLPKLKKEQIRAVITLWRGFL